MTDTSRSRHHSMRSHNTTFNDYWRVRSQVPMKSIKNLVPDTILQKDLQTCDLILRKLFNDLASQDQKQNLLQKRRHEMRTKLVERHYRVRELEERSGVRLGMSRENRYLQVGQQSVSGGLGIGHGLGDVGQMEEFLPK